MKKFRKAFCLVLIASFLVYIPLGCSKGDVPSDNSKDVAPSSSRDSSGDSSEPNKSDDIKDKPIRILRRYVDFDVKTDNSVKVLEEGTGFDLEFDTLPEKNPLDKLNLIFTSGQVDYDYIMLEASDNEKSAYATYAKKDLLVDLTDLIPKYPNLSKIDPLAFEGVKVDERIYAIGSTGLPNPNENNMIRIDWLKKMNMDVPTTREEFYEVLKAFKEQDPDQNGSDNIPMVAGPSVMVSGIATTFGILYDYEDRDGKIVDARLLPEYKEYLSFMNQLYDEGLLDTDMPINTGSTISEKVAAGKVGYFCGWVDDAKNLLVAKREQGEDGTFFQAIPPLKDPEGKQRTRSTKGLFGIGMIPKSSDNIEGVLSYIDAYLESEAFESMIHGEEGVDFIVEDNKRIPTDTFNEARGNLFAFFPLQDGDAYHPLWMMRTRKLPEYTAVFEDILKASEDYQESGVLAYSPAFDSISQEVKIVNEYASQEATKFIAGARSLDEFDTFVEEMKYKGADKIVEAYNEWYTNK